MWPPPFLTQSDVDRPLMCPPKVGWLEPSVDEIARISRATADYLEAWFQMGDDPITGGLLWRTHVMRF